MKPWPEILVECGRLLLQIEDHFIGETSPPRRHLHPEAALRVRLAETGNNGTTLESVVGGIPDIVTCVVHSIAPRLMTQWLATNPSEQPIGIVMRQSRREDLYLLYRSGDTSLVICTLPEKLQSKVMLVPLETDDVIRQATLGENVCRIEFCALKPGAYLVASFSMVNLDALQRQALLLREQGMHSEALVLLEEVLQIDPEDFLAWTRKGCELRALERPDEAMAAVEQALKINSECAFSWRAKGALLRDAGKHQDGLSCYLRSLKLDPTDFLCWENKGNALRALGKEAQARKAYAKAVEVKALHPEEKH